MMRSRSAASSLREAEKHLARISPWLRWDPKTKSSTLSWEAWPTTADSWPMLRWAGPRWLYSTPFHAPVVLMELSMVSKLRTAIMSCRMSISPCLP